MTATKVVGHFGRLWGRGFEILKDHRIFQVRGQGATPFLQNLVTSDLQQIPTPPRPEPLGSKRPGVPQKIQDEPPPTVEFSDVLRSTCFLDQRGRIVTDSLLWKQDLDNYFIEVPTDAADNLLRHLKQYKLRRSKVDIAEPADVQSSVIFGTLSTAGTPPGYLAGLDPRHPSLGLRILRIPEGSADTLSSLLHTAKFPESPGNYTLVRRLVGVAEGAEITGKTALETNQEQLQAVSFSKGCYLGQELTARVQHTGVLRKRILPCLLLDSQTQVPQPWSLASSLQEGRQKKKFTASELAELPSRLPKLSVAAAGNMIAVTTASVEPASTADVSNEAMEELAAVQKKVSEWLETDVAKNCTAGQNMVDTKTGETVGQIIAPPVPGTNVLLALMRLEAVGLLSPGVWSKTNKVKVGEAEFRYLPYLPLWMPDLDPSTGKAKEGTDYSDEAMSEEDAQRHDAQASKSGGMRIVLEEEPKETEQEKPST